MTLEQLCYDFGLTPEGIEHALKAYQTIICEITHGMLSKLTYDASYVLNCAQDRWCETCDIKEEMQNAGWVSVKDRMPEKSGTYLCYQPKAADICALNTVRWSTQRGWMGKEVESRIEGIEYWMPLPEPPEEVGVDA